MWGRRSLNFPFVPWKSWAGLTEAGEHSQPGKGGEAEYRVLLWIPGLWSFPGRREDVETSLVQDQIKKEDSAEGMEME